VSITIYTLTYNEAYILPYFIAHYRKNFPGCRIVIFDNDSTDDTRKIAQAAGCKVLRNDTNGKLDDASYLEIKNNCWKPGFAPPVILSVVERSGGGWQKLAATEHGSSSPFFQGEAGRGSWAIVCDCDELLDITAADLAEEEARGTTAIRGFGYNMVNVQSMPFHSIRHGVRAPSYDKLVCFDTRAITEINYGAGCHSENPEGRVQLSTVPYRLRHYKYINPDYMVQRHAIFASRLSENNKKHGWGCHYQYSEADIRAEFEAAKRKAKIIM